MTIEDRKINNFQLENFDGSEFDLYRFGKESFVLLVFFRGAWCSHCKKQLADLQTSLPEFNKLNIKIVALASDVKFKLSLLRTFLKLDFTVLADENLRVINKFNLQTEYKSHKVSKPAVYLMNPQKEIIFSYISEEYDDRLSSRKILEAIKEIL
jgi:peroxiredoxin